MSDDAHNRFLGLAEETLPGHFGLEFHEVRSGYVRASMALKPFHFAPNGYVHAASVIALADSASGYGCMASRPEGAHSFTTIELKSNFLGTARDGELTCEARLVHGGRTTQVWDAEVKRGDGKLVALFRCTQMLLYPKAAASAG